MRKIDLSHEYSVAPDVLWRMVINFQALEKVMRGLIRFSGLPDGDLFTGQVADVRVSLFGVLPSQPYRMKVLLRDDATLSVHSTEHGAGVKRWEHRFQVIPTDAGCRLVESIEIEAGILTPLFARWARFLYTRRHPARLALLAEKTTQDIQI